MLFLFFSYLLYRTTPEVLYVSPRLLRITYTSHHISYFRLGDYWLELYKFIVNTVCIKGPLFKMSGAVRHKCLAKVWSCFHLISYFTGEISLFFLSECFSSLELIQAYFWAPIRILVMFHSKYDDSPDEAHRLTEFLNVQFLIKNK